MIWTARLFPATAALLFAVAGPSFGQPAGQLDAVSTQVRKADEEFRLAKLQHDIPALNRILADGFYETNQNGNSRDKAQTLELWRDFRIESLTTDSYQVRLAGDQAFVTGTQTENQSDRMIFTRIFIKGSNGWQLLSATQFHNPNPPAPDETYRRQLAALGGVEADVMKVDDEFRVAKVKKDTVALDRLLADDFYETNQNGNSRNKAEMIDLFRSFDISSLTTDSFQVRVSGSAAIVSGAQTESGSDHMLFTRVYSRGAKGWQLLSSTQFLNPNLASRTF